MKEIDKEKLSLAGEYVVASELCRRGIYAQLTLGTRKRTDLLVDTETAMLRIQVKAKQGRNWPYCKGIFGENMLLIFVDYKNKELELTKRGKRLYEEINDNIKPYINVFKKLREKSPISYTRKVQTIFKR